MHIFLCIFKVAVQDTFVHIHRWKHTQSIVQIEASNSVTSHGLAWKYNISASITIFQLKWRDTCNIPHSNNVAGNNKCHVIYICGGYKYTIYSFIFVVGKVINICYINIC